MTAVRQLRRDANVTQQQLAERAGTSQPTIAAYESGVKSPALSTLHRLAASLGLELWIRFVPATTREDRRSLAFHRAIAKLLADEPALIVARAKRNLARQVAHHPHARTLFNRWSAWLALPTEDLLALMLHPGVSSREMRHVSPLSGLLSAADRVRVLAEFRKEQGA